MFAGNIDRYCLRLSYMLCVTIALCHFNLIVTWRFSFLFMVRCRFYSGDAGLSLYA